jgi:Arm DNA-binding domain
MVKSGGASHPTALSAKETIAKPGYHADGDGLYLVVDASGARRWAYIYHSAGKRREMGLGRMGLKEAREAAEEVRRQVRQGNDPIAARRQARVATTGIPTFEAIAAEVIADAHKTSPWGGGPHPDCRDDATVVSRQRDGTVVWALHRII